MRLASELGCKIQLVVMADKAAAVNFMKARPGYEPASLPDLVVLDLNLYGEDGFMVLEEMRATQQLANLATVIFSSSQLLQDQQRAKQLGAMDFLYPATVPNTNADAVSAYTAHNLKMDRILGRRPLRG